jgi:hypothetical protein
MLRAPARVNTPNDLAGDAAGCAGPHVGNDGRHLGPADIARALRGWFGTDNYKPVFSNAFVQVRCYPAVLAAPRRNPCSVATIVQDLHVRLVRQSAPQSAVESFVARLDDEELAYHGANALQPCNST